MKLVIAGGGYVGLATGVGFGRHGHEIELIEINPERAAQLRRGELPFHEPSLAQDLAELSGRNLTVHTGYPDSIEGADFAFICVDTYPAEDGHLDSTRVASAAQSLIDTCGSDVPLVLRSTVNPGTSVMVRELRAERGTPGAVLMNPEFLREGTALWDFDHPSRRVVGGNDPEAVEKLVRLYDFPGGTAPVLRTDATTAEVIKMAANAALAVRVSMANEIAHIADAAGASPEAVLAAIGGDPRIGPDFLQPGIGFGGSCLPKDLSAFVAAARRVGVPSPVFAGTESTNDFAIDRLVGRVCQLVGVTPGTQRNGKSHGRVCVVGVGFKPGSDSVRSSQSIRLVRSLIAEGFDVGVLDPVAEANARVELADGVSYERDFETVLGSYDVVIEVFPDSRHAQLRSPQARWIDGLGRQLGVVEAQQDAQAPVDARATVEVVSRHE
jgi:UDPglucose 6-dehydrogenase